jgi:hypothetical protein
MKLLFHDDGGGVFKVVVKDLVVAPGQGEGLIRVTAESPVGEIMIAEDRYWSLDHIVSVAGQ